MFRRALKLGTPLPLPTPYAKEKQFLDPFFLRLNQWWKRRHLPDHPKPEQIFKDEGRIQISSPEVPFIYCENNRVVASGECATAMYKVPTAFTLTRDTERRVWLRWNAFGQLLREVKGTSFHFLDAEKYDVLFQRHFIQVERVCHSSIAYQQTRLALLGREFRIDMDKTAALNNTITIRLGSRPREVVRLPFQFDVEVDKDATGNGTLTVSSLPLHSPRRKYLTHRVTKLQRFVRYLKKGFVDVEKNYFLKPSLKSSKRK